jgi:hypothetical protein
MVTPPIRARLPWRRDSRLVEFEHEGVGFTVGYTRDDQGRILELFVSGPKIGSAASALAIDGAILASLVLQLGADAHELAHSLSHTAKEEPASAIGAALDAALADVSAELDRDAAPAGEPRLNLFPTPTPTREQT